MKNLVFAFLLASTITVAQPPNWRMDDALSATRNPTVAAEVDRLLSLTAIYATSDLLRELDTIANGQWNDAQVDWIFEQYAIGLRDAFPDTVTSAALNHLASYEVRALVPHPDSDGYGVPAFPVRAAVAGTQAHWEYTQSYEGAMYALRSADPWMFAEIAQTEPSEIRITAINEVLREAHPAEVAAIIPGIQLAVDMQPDAARLLITAAARTNDSDLLQWLADRPDAMKRVIPSLADLDAVMGKDTAADFWLDLVHRNVEPTVTSVAVSRLGQYVYADSQVAKRLVLLLSDPQLGSSAALALGDARATDILIGVLIDSSQQPRARKNAIIGMRGTRDGETMMRSALAGASKSVREEVAAWLK